MYCALASHKRAATARGVEGARKSAHLLPEADTGPAVEGEEDERVRGQILVQALVEEAIGVELLSVGTPQVLAAMHEQNGPRYTAGRVSSTSKRGNAVLTGCS